MVKSGTNRLERQRWLQDLLLVILAGEDDEERAVTGAAAEGI